MYVGQGNTIGFDGRIFFHDFFVSSWLIFWVDGINGHSWCLARSRGCWVKGSHQIPSLSWMFHDSQHFCIHYIVSFEPRISWSLCCYCKQWRDRKGGWWFIYVTVWVGGRGWVSYFHIFCSVIVLLFVIFSWLVHDSCYVYCSFFASFVSGSFNLALPGRKNFCICFVKLFQKSGFWSLLCEFPWKRESAVISITL